MGIEARAIELIREDGRFWAAGKTDTMSIEDPAPSVWQPSVSDGGVADVFGIDVVGRELSNSWSRPCRL